MLLYFVVTQVEDFQEKLTAFDDFNRHFKKFDKKLMARLDTALEMSIPKLMRQMPTVQEDTSGRDAVDKSASSSNPFGDDGVVEVEGGHWVCSFLKG